MPRSAALPPRAPARSSAAVAAPSTRPQRRASDDADAAATASTSAAATAAATAAAAAAAVGASAQQPRDDGVLERLAVCVRSEAVRQWAAAEFFVAPIDRAFLSNAELNDFLADHFPIRPNTRVTRALWASMRRRLGRPRRFSRRLVAEELGRLRRSRENVRALASNMALPHPEDALWIPRHHPLVLSVGDTVNVRLPHAEFCSGVVVAVDVAAGKYRVRLDDSVMEAALRPAAARDTPQSMRSSVSGVSLVGHIASRTTLFARRPSAASNSPASARASIAATPTTGARGTRQAAAGSARGGRGGKRAGSADSVPIASDDGGDDDDDDEAIAASSDDDDDDGGGGGDDRDDAGASSNNGTRRVLGKRRSGSAAATPSKRVNGGGDAELGGGREIVVDDTDVMLCLPPPAYVPFPQDKGPSRMMLHVGDMTRAVASAAQLMSEKAAILAHIGQMNERLEQDNTITVEFQAEYADSVVRLWRVNHALIENLTYLNKHKEALAPPGQAPSNSNSAREHAARIVDDLCTEHADLGERASTKARDLVANSLAALLTMKASSMFGLSTRDVDDATTELRPSQTQNAQPYQQLLASLAAVKNGMAKRHQPTVPAASNGAA